jgi:4-hydroxy-tetrahydrodipicolinate reductase
VKRKPLKVWIHGISGRMGVEIQSALKAQTDTFELVGGSEKKFVGTLNEGQTVTPDKLAKALTDIKADLIFDFSNAEANQILEAAISKGKVKQVCVLIGSTGLNDGQLKKWQKIATTQGLKVLSAPNTSLGILILQNVARQAARALKGKGFDIEIVESHHRNKVDSPSGTALLLAKNISEEIPKSEIISSRKSKRRDEEIGVHSIRGGNVFGEHHISFLGDSEEIVFSHRALSRSLFANGALVLGKWLADRKPGFYGLSDVELF